jgi:glycerol-3-phosphate dehydrogenase
MRFVLPHSPEQRPAWLVRLGLFLYDHLGGRQILPGCRRIDLTREPEGRPLKQHYRLGFEYSDCWVDDSRLVVLNALDARERGARILTRTAAALAKRIGGEWQVELSGADGTRSIIRARALVNAAGPWVENVADRMTGENAVRRVRLVKGSHIIVPKFWDGPQAYLLQNHDKRVIFVNPYEGDLCLIGTTDIPYDDQPENVQITEGEIDYLLEAVNRYTRKQLRRADVRSSFSGVRPLYDDNAASPSAVTRDYVFDIAGHPPILSVFGGKITTYRKLAEHALQRLKPYFPAMREDWTSQAALPGGEMPGADFVLFQSVLQREHPWLLPDISYHLARLYGTRANVILSGAGSLSALGRHFGGTLYERELHYLKTNEWAQTAEDVLERRTKYGLHLTPEQKQDVARYMGH